MRWKASIGFTPAKSVPACFFATRFTFRTMRGGLPRRTLMSMSIGESPKCESSRTSLPSPVATPMKATGQRSRRHSSSKKPRASGRSARTYRSCASQHQISIGFIERSSLWTSRSSNLPPVASTSSGQPLERPPAPMSWIDMIGFALPR